jgi:hypothetical protein
MLYESPLRLGLTDNRIVFGAREQEILLSDFDYLAQTYFRNPAYYRVGGRPVVVLYVSRIFRGAYAEAIAALRERMQAMWGIELYLIGDEVDWDLGPSRAWIRLYDAITGYTSTAARSLSPASCSSSRTAIARSSVWPPSGASRSFRARSPATTTAASGPRRATTS